MGPPKRSLSQASGVWTSSQNSSVVDVRFAELLKPIKDLTVNWSVPLAKYLEDYYEELHDLQINLDDHTAKVNFAEAALFLQGTASVYSKKVEFLWQNVLKMLDLLASKKALEEAGDNDDENADENGKKRSKKSTFDGSQFSLVGIELATKSTNAMKSDTDNNSVHSRKLTLKFIFVTPRQLIEKEGKDQKMTRVNMYVKSGSLSKYDLLGQKEEFRVNSQFALGTGMIGEELSGESDLAQQSVSLCNDSSALLLQNTTVIQNIPEEPEMIQEEEQVVEEDDFVIAEPFSDPEEPPPDPLPDLEEIENEESRKKRKVAEDFLNEPKAPLEETWEPLEPHEVVTIAKPIRKGRRKLPKKKFNSAAAPDVSKVKKSFTKSRGQVVHSTEAGGLKVMVPIEEFLIQELQKKSSIVVDCNNVPASLRDEVAASLKARKINKDNNENIQDKLDEEDEILDQNEAAAENHENEHWEDFQDQDDFLPAATFDDDHVDPPTDVDQDNVDKDTYEELVMKRVADYVAQSQDYIQSTDLAKRVRHWHESLAPKLEAVEMRGDFDIHEYGSKILHKFPNDARKTTLDFANQVAKGNSKEEVSRLFLSTLMLANAQNIDISCNAEKTDSMPMDQVDLTLLSTQRHHEHMLESIPSEVESSSKQTKIKRKKKLDVIQEEEYQETLEVFDAMPVSRKSQFAVPTSIPKSTSKVNSKSKGGRTGKTSRERFPSDQL